MVTRSECDASFQFIGYPYFRRIPTQQLNTVLQTIEERLGDQVNQSPNRLLLINARRCNNMCNDDDDPDDCNRKIQHNFDLAESAEYCLINPYSCYYRLKVYLRANLIIGEPIHLNTQLFSHLRDTANIYTYPQFKRKYGDAIIDLLQLPINRQNNEPLDPTNLHYIVDDITDDLITSLLAQLYPISNAGRQCYSPCEYGYWGKWPVRRYGCYTNPQKTLFDLCDPEYRPTPRNPSQLIRINDDDDDEFVYLN